MKKYIKAIFIIDNFYVCNQYIYILYKFMLNNSGFFVKIEGITIILLLKN